MSETALINEGLSLMMFGMGFVFIFLTVLVIATSLMSKIVLTVAPDKPVPAVRSFVPVDPADPASDPVLLAVVKDAVRQHRARRQ